MEDQGKNRKKIKWKIIALAVAACILAACLPPCAAFADSWTGWTDEKIEEAWTVYVVTEWNDVSGLRFSVSDSGSVASADVPDSFRNTYGPIIESVLIDRRVTTQFYGSSSQYDKRPYMELMLAISYCLNKKGEAANGLSTETTDICFVNTYINPSASINSVEGSFSYLFARLAASEGVYCRSHINEAAGYSIYTNDELLAAVLQGIVYGTGFCGEYAQYSSSAAADYYANHIADIPVKWNSFADEVEGRYTAIRSNTEHTVIG